MMSPHRNHRRRLRRDLRHTSSLGSVAYEAKGNERGERLIWLEAAMAARLGAMRGPNESYSDAILRIVARSSRERMA
jgi:hypothetical protein